MKTITTLSIFFFALNLCYSQNLNLKMLEQLVNAPFSQIDNGMINGYGFEKYKEDDVDQKHFVKISNDDFDSAIIINIANVEDKSRNILDIKLAKNFSIRKIKDDLVVSGFLYQGSYSVWSSIYKNNDLYFLFTDPNEFGATSILVMFNFQN
jgi:hypothetical protein